MYRFAKATIALLVASLLCSCAALSTNGYVIPTTLEVKPGALYSLDEQQYKTDKISDGIERWLDNSEWSGSYLVSGSPVIWIPVETDSAFPATISRDACRAWIPFKSQKESASISNSYVYRIVDSHGKSATEEDLDFLYEKISSDFQRQGWELYEPSVNSSSIGWKVPLKDERLSVVDDYSTEVSGEPLEDYLSYQVIFTKTKNGYVIFSVNSPCTQIDAIDYWRLQGDSDSKVFDLIANDR